jgi:hypothetical protein
LAAARSALTFFRYPELNVAVIYILVSVVAVLGFLGLFPAAFAVTIVGGPSANRHLATWALCLAILTFPLVCLVSIMLTWSAWESPIRAWLLLIPLFNVFVGVVALQWINFFQDGKFTGASSERNDGR